MLLKINCTNGSSSWPSIQGGLAVFLCLFFPVMVCQQCCPFPSVRLLDMSLPMFPYVFQEAEKNPSTYGPVSHCCHSQYSSAGLTHGCCLSALCDFSSLCFHFAFCFLSHTLQCLSVHPLFLCLCSDMLEALFTFGKWFYFAIRKANLIPLKCFFSNTPESWEQETVSSFSSFQNILGCSDTAGIKAGTHQKHPNQQEQPWSSQSPWLLSALPVRHVHLISSLPCLLFLLQAQQRNLFFTKFS